MSYADWDINVCEKTVSSIAKTFPDFYVSLSHFRFFRWRKWIVNKKKCFCALADGAKLINKCRNALSEFVVVSLREKFPLNIQRTVKRQFSFQTFLKAIAYRENY